MHCFTKAIDETDYNCNKCCQLVAYVAYIRAGLTIGQTGQIPGASRLIIKTLLYWFFMFLRCSLCVKIIEQQLQALAFQQAFWGIACLVLLPSSCNDSSLYLSFINVCKATSVTHTKRIYRIYCAINCDRFAWCGSLMWLYKHWVLISRLLCFPSALLLLFVIPRYFSLFRHHSVISSEPLLHHSGGWIDLCD